MAWLLQTSLNLLTSFDYVSLVEDSLRFTQFFTWFSAIFSAITGHNSVEQPVQLSRNSAATRLPLGFQVIASKGSSKGWDSWGKVSGAGAVLCQEVLQVLQVLHVQTNKEKYQLYYIFLYIIITHYSIMISKYYDKAMIVQMTMVYGEEARVWCCQS